MSTDTCQETPLPGLVEGIAQFNRGEFFECHETLEEIWLAEPRPIRHLYQGILQIGVAFYHLRRGRYRAAMHLLERGSGYLQPFSTVCQGVDVGGLLADAARCLAEIRRLGPGSAGDFDWSLVPKIEMRNEK